MVTVANRTKIEEGILLDFEKIVKIVIISYFKDINKENVVK